jgi:hypothetical protein
MAFCEKCGSQLKEGARFCGKCGANVTPVSTIQPQNQNIATPANWQQTVTPIYYTVVPDNSTITAKGKSSKKVILIILAAVVIFIFFLIINDGETTTSTQTQNYSRLQNTKWVSTEGALFIVGRYTIDFGKGNYIYSYEYILFGLPVSGSETGTYTVSEDTVIFTSDSEKTSLGGDGKQITGTIIGRTLTVGGTTYNR